MDINRDKTSTGTLETAADDEVVTKAISALNFERNCADITPWSFIIPLC